MVIGSSEGETRNRSWSWRFPVDGTTVVLVVRRARPPRGVRGGHTGTGTPGSPAPPPPKAAAAGHAGAGPSPNFGVESLRDRRWKSMSFNALLAPAMNAYAPSAVKSFAAGSPIPAVPPHRSSPLLVTSCSQAGCSGSGWSRLSSSCRVSASSWRTMARLRSACPYAMAASPFTYGAAVRPADVHGRVLAFGVGRVCPARCWPGGYWPRNAFTSVPNSTGYWKRKPWPASG
jgi:hypothetical protein